LSRTNSTYQASPQNFFPFSYEETIGESALDDFLYVKENHLGSVLTVVSDRKLGVDVTPTDGIVDYYLADVTSATDYYAFGSPMPGRKFNSNSYKYGFNGKENDPEVVSTGQGTQDYGFRIYNPSLGKFLSVDPITREYPFYSPYHFAGNTPIHAIDLDGLEPRSMTASYFLSSLRSVYGDALISAGNWIDKAFSYTNNSEASAPVKKATIAQVTNETNVKVKVSTTATTNIGKKLAYIKANNNDEGDPSPLVTVKSKLESQVENKTSVTFPVGVAKVTLSNATTKSSNGEVTNKSEVTIEAIVPIEGVPVPVVNKTSMTTNSNGTVSTSSMTGVGTSDVNVGIVVKTSTDKSGTVASGGVGLESKPVKSEVLINVNRTH